MTIEKVISEMWFANVAWNSWKIWSIFWSMKVYIGFFNKSWSLKIKNGLQHNIELEFRAHSGPSCSTHGYFESWKDEGLTPSGCWDPEFYFFSDGFSRKHNVNYLENALCFIGAFRPPNRGQISNMDLEVDKRIRNSQSAMYELV